VLNNFCTAPYRSGFRQFFHARVRFAVVDVESISQVSTYVILSTGPSTRSSPSARSLPISRLLRTSASVDLVQSKALVEVVRTQGYLTF
jgi:hypothetical protein